MSWSEIQCQLNRLNDSCAAITDLPTGDTRLAVAKYEDMCEPTAAAIELHDTLTQAKSRSDNLHDIERPQWHDINSVHQLSDILIHITAVRKKRSAAKQLMNLTQPLSSGATPYRNHSLVQDAVSAIQSRDVEG